MRVWKEKARPTEAMNLSVAAELYQSKDKGAKAGRVIMIPWHKSYWDRVRLEVAKAKEAKKTFKVAWSPDRSSLRSESGPASSSAAPASDLASVPLP
jgi:hypothetical protein